MIRPPVGKITQIGDAGATSRGLNANDDFYVSGLLEIDGYSYFDELVYFYNGYAFQAGYGCSTIKKVITEEMIVLVGNNNGVSVANLAPAGTIIEAVAVRVNQAPASPSYFNIGRTALFDPDEYIDHQLTALGGRFNNVAQSDGTIAGPHYNVADSTFTMTTEDAGGIQQFVTGQDFKVRVVVIFKEVVNPTS